MDETRWIYVAMVAFLFLRWLINQFKVAAVKREELRQRRLKGFDEGALARAEATNARRMPPPLPAPAQRQSAPAEPFQKPEEAPQTFQELFQQLRQEIKRAQEVEERRPETPSRSAPVSPTRQNQRNPPQASAKQKKRNQPKQAPPVSEAPREPVPPPLVQSPMAADSHYQKSASKKSAITAILSDPEKTRHAVILREILGRPRGLND